MENKPLGQPCPHPGTSSATALRTELDSPGSGVCQSKAQPRWEWNSILANPAELNPPLIPLPQIPAAQWLVLVTVKNPAQCSQRSFSAGRGGWCCQTTLLRSAGGLPPPPGTPTSLLCPSPAAPGDPAERRGRFHLCSWAGNAPGVTRAGLWGLRDSKEGTQQKPPAPRTHLFVQRGLLQWDGLLGLATFVEPKPLHKNG